MLWPQSTEPWWEHMPPHDPGMGADSVLLYLDDPAGFSLHRRGLTAFPTDTKVNPGDDKDDGGTRTGPLGWYNVLVASALIFVDGLISIVMGLQLEDTLFISAARCLVQLTAMGYLLEFIFATRNPVLVFLMASFLILMATYETVFSKCKRRHANMFFTVIMSFALSTMLVASLGGLYALNSSPFWYPYKFIPTLGMLLANGMTGTALGLNACLTSVSEHKERVETYLAMGATRWEAVRPVAVEALRSAMLPTLNNMSIMGLISIPGMMTGQILGGVPVSDAVKYQQIIAFMIAASTALASLGAVLVCLHTVVDQGHRLRLDRIYPSGSLLMRERRGLKQATRFIFGARSGSSSSSSGDEICTAEYNHSRRVAGCKTPTLAANNGAEEASVWTRIRATAKSTAYLPVRGARSLASSTNRLVRRIRGTADRSETGTPDERTRLIA
ncbi:hypothetical protein IWQ60_007700 [Tieghemiomyces parasiticus]|uniref:Uncharacterized protein n=1 Tax=Tieghemiomyces parasiticus TaxID=78921 RepID=A0A9W8A2E7_9FUNG|nr:hypothetical protein IWQ60_007700 [Tieghemiomyces parasiticus]